MNFDINQTAFYSGNKVSRNERKKSILFAKIPSRKMIKEQLQNLKIYIM